MSLRRRPTCQALSKSLDVSSAIAQAAPDLLKALEILSDKTVRRSEVDQGHLKLNYKDLDLFHKFLNTGTAHRKI